MKYHTSNLAIGENVLKCEPYAHVLSIDKLDAFCHFCFKECADLKTCSTCKYLKYCGRTCQKSDWTIHKLECSCLNGVNHDELTDSLRLFLRILIRRELGDNVKVINGDPGLRTFDDCQSHVEEIRKDAERCFQFSRLCQFIKSLAGDQFQLPDTSTLFIIFGQMVINTFTIQSPDSLNAIGSGLYVSASSLNHSCDPICIAIFDGATLFIRAIKETKHNSEITISYIDQLALTADRQLQLQQQYYFTCHCTRCSHSIHDENMQSVSCIDPICSGRVRMREKDYKECDVCGKPRTSENVYDELQAINLSCAETLKTIKKHKQSGTMMGALMLCKKTLQHHGAILHQTHISSIQILDETFDLCINLERWNDAVKYGSSLMSAFKHVYPRYHPATGLLILKLAKIHIYIGDSGVVPLVRDLLLEARELLTVSHGSGHSIMTHVTRLEIQAQALRYEKDH